MAWIDNDLTAFASATPALGGGSVLDGYSHSDGSQHVNFVDGSGHVHELYRSPDPAVQWVDNDLTKFAGGTPAAAGNGHYGYSKGDGSGHVNFVDGSGHVHELYRSPDPVAQWVDNDLTKFAGGTPAVAGSALHGYVQSDGSQHVNFIDGSGQVHELYRSPDPVAQWVDNDLTRFAGGTPAVGGSSLAGYSENDGSQHVNFIALYEGEAIQHVHELYRSSDPGAQWVEHDLTAIVQAESVFYVALALDGYSQNDGSQHVNFRGASLEAVSSDVHELYKGPYSSGQWVDNDLTEFAGGTSVGADVLVGYAQNGGGQQVNYVDGSGHVHELFFGTLPNISGPACGWVDRDLTALAGGTPAAGDALAGYSQSDGSQHVNFLDSNGHVHELYESP